MNSGNQPENSFCVSPAHSCGPQFPLRPRTPAEALTLCGWSVTWGLLLFHHGQGCHTCLLEMTHCSSVVRSSLLRVTSCESTYITHCVELQSKTYALQSSSAVSVLLEMNYTFLSVNKVIFVFTNSSVSVK